MPDISIRVAAQDEASAALGAVGTSALSLGTNFETADVKISGVVQRMRDGASLASTEWTTFSTAYATGWTNRTTAATVADGVLIALEAAQKIRGTTVVNEEAANTVLRVKNYTDIGIASGNLDYMDGVRNANAYVRLGQLGGWWTAARDTILGVIDRSLLPGFDRFVGGLGGLVTASDTTATAVGGAFVRMANDVVREVARAQAARDALARAAAIPAPAPGGGAVPLSVGSSGGGGGGGAAAAVSGGGVAGSVVPKGGGTVVSSIIKSSASTALALHGDRGFGGDSGYGTDEPGFGRSGFATGFDRGNGSNNVGSWGTLVNSLAAPGFEQFVWPPGGPDLGLYGDGSMTGVRGRAAGGPVSAGSSYLVGEQGPEMFVPSASGTIISNDAMGGWSRASGGGSVNVQTLNIYGVQDVGAMFTSVLREARARGVAIG